MAGNISTDSLDVISVSTTRTECGICLEDVNRPKLLPCFHSFCVKCLQRHINSNSSSGFFKCPLCRRRLEKPSNGAEGFEDNIYTESINGDSCGNEMICQACDEVTASQTCVECKQIYCEGCAKLHLKMAPSKLHVIRAANKQDSRLKVASKKFCEIHQNKKLSYYCIECKLPICGKCIIDKHKSHACDEITEIAKTHKAELNEMLLSQKYGYQFVAMLEARATEVKKQKSAFQNEVYNECLKIESHANRIKERVDKAKTSLVDAVLAKEKDIVKRYNSTNEDANGKLKWAKGTVQTVAQILEVSSDTEVVTKYEEIRKELIELEAQILPTRMYHSEIKFMLNTPSAEEMVRSIGYIEVRGPIQFETLSRIEFPSRSLLPPTIQSICPLSVTEACVAFDNCIQTCDKYGKKQQEIEFKERVFAVAADSSDSIFVACKSAIHVLRQRERLEKLFDLSDVPSGLALTKEGHFAISFEKAGCVGLYEMDGRKLVQFDKAYTRSPSAICVHGAKVFVLDLNGTDITVFDQTGQVLPIIQTDERVPLSLTVHPKGKIAIGDSNGCVQLLSGNGDHLQTLVSPRQKGHASVTSLTFDPTGDLWIGDASGIVHVLYECK